MKQLVVAPLILLVVLIACRPSSQTAAERRTAAARADSSAAGYEVGVVSAPTPDTTVSAILDSTQGATTVGPAVGPGSKGGTVTPTPTIPVPSTKPPAPRQVVTVADTSRGRRGGGSSPSAGLPPLDPAVEATFLAFDTLKKTATFQLAAGTEILDQVSFNGVRRGARVLTVPVGWRLGIEFTNRDAELPHSAMVVADSQPIPEQLPLPAFSQAQTVKVDEGLLEGDSDEIRFLADRVGRYLIACGVMRHAQRGQWLVLEISASATVPTYR
jgi:hypothetical protein